MIAKLIFKLPEEREEFELTRKAGAMSCALSEFREYLRKLRKYDERDTVTIEEVTEEFFRICNENEVEI